MGGATLGLSIYRGSCDCGWRSDTRNTVAKANRHHQQCRQHIIVEIERALSWPAEARAASTEQGVPDGE